MRKPFRIPWRSLMVPALTTFLSFALSGPGTAAPRQNGAALYGKHCALCHPETTRLKMADDLLDSLRMPPPGMPSFSEDKLSDADVQALGAFIRPEEKQAPAAERAPATPQAAIAAPAPAPQAAPRSGTEDAPRAGRKQTEKSAWNSALAKNWTIKGSLNGGVVTVKKFAISAKADSDPEVLLTDEVPERTVKVTAFRVAGRTLKLELTWGWNLNPGYWKTESFDLRLSPDGKKLAGTYALRTSGGHSEDSQVWGE